MSWVHLLVLTKYPSLRPSFHPHSVRPSLLTFCHLLTLLSPFLIIPSFWPFYILFPPSCPFLPSFLPRTTTDLSMGGRPRHGWPIQADWPAPRTVLQDPWGEGADWAPPPRQSEGAGGHTYIDMSRECIAVESAGGEGRTKDGDAAHCTGRTDLSVCLARWRVGEGGRVAPPGWLKMSAVTLHTHTLQSMCLGRLLPLVRSHSPRMVFALSHTLIPDVLAACKV